jgi:GMP synthase-like glutamine amidotransferase
MLPRMKRLIVLQHVPHEGPGRLVPHLVRNGFQIQVRRLDAGDAVPAAADADAFLVMGGPMGVADLADARWPFLARECDLLADCLARGVPAAGVCLGAQLLAHAAGGTVAPLTAGDPPLRVREVGWGAVHHPPDRMDDPLLAGLGPAEVVLHWHGDAVITLPPGAVRLASSLHCPNQLFRIGHQHVGVQFHPEVEGADVETWLAADQGWVEQTMGPDARARIRTDTALWMPRLRISGDRLCRNIADALAGA